MRIAMSVYRLAFAALTLAAITAEYVAGVRANPAFSPVNFFSFFTIISNLIAVSAFLDGVARPRARIDWWRGLAVTCMAIAGIVFALLLRDAEIMPIAWVNAVVHEVMPLAVVADWLLAPPREHIGMRAALGWLALPVVYLVYSLVRGATAGWYPYPFLNAATLGYGGVALYICAIFAACLVVILTVAAIGNRRRSPVTA